MVDFGSGTATLSGINKVYSYVWLAFSGISEVYFEVYFGCPAISQRSNT